MDSGIKSYPSLVVILLPLLIYKLFFPRGWLACGHLYVKLKVSRADEIPNDKSLLRELLCELELEVFANKLGLLSRERL